MAGQAIWKGVIGLGDTEVPVKLYSAVEDSRVHFRLLHEKDHEPVRQRMVNPATAAEVPHEEIRKGYETDAGTLVMLTAKELEALEPEPSRAIRVTRFLEKGIVSHQWYERPYWLGPDGDPAGYGALAAALERSGREGIAHWVMRGKRYHGVLRAVDGHAMLITLRPAEEVVLAGALEPPSGRDLGKREVAMAEQLIEALAGEFDPEAYRDEHQDRLRQLIEAKAEGGTIELRRPRPKKSDRSLSDALKESLRQAGRRKTA